MRTLPRLTSALLGAAFLLACESDTQPTPRFDTHPSDQARTALLSPPAADLVLDVVIDTDVGNEIDDQFALVYALLSPERLNVQAIYAAPWSLSADLFLGGTGTSELDLRILEANLAKFNLTIENLPALSPEDGVARAFRDAAEIVALVGSPLGDAVFQGAPAFMSDAETPVDSPAAQHLIALARARGADAAPLYVVVNGAATNVASVLLLAPDIAERIVVVWTSAYPTFWDRPNASYNMAQDVHAARVLFNGTTQTVYIPGFYVAEELRTSAYEMAAQVDGVGPIGAFLYDLYDNQLFASGDDKTKVIWDLATIAWLVDPSWFTSKLVRTPTLDDSLRWQHEPGRPLMGEVIDANRDGVFADLFVKLGAYAAGDPAGM